MLTNINLPAGPMGETPVSGVRDRVLELGSLKRIGALDPDTLWQLAEQVIPHFFVKGELLLDDSEVIEMVHLVLEGQVTVTQQGRSIRVFSDSGAVGLHAVLAGGELGIRAIADADTRTLGIPADVLLDLYESNFPMVRNALRVLAKQLLTYREGLPQEDNGPTTNATWLSNQLTMVERVIKLRKNALFSTTNLDAVLELAKQGREIRGSAGDVLWNQGDLSDFWLHIDYGRIGCTAADGKVLSVGPDYILGLLDALHAESRAYRAEAESDYIAFRIERDVMLAILEGHFDLSRHMLTSLSELVFVNQASQGEIQP